MTATPYQPIQWSNQEPLFKDKLNQMTNNDQWLFENMPKLYYNVSGIKRSTGIKAAAGFGVFNASANRYAAGTVTFGDYFSQGCQPVVVLGALQTYPQREVIATIRGIGTIMPDHRGFEVYLTAVGTAKKISSIVYAPWIAIGY